MEAGFKMEEFACFVSEMSRNIYAKEQKYLPKGLQELLVSQWGCTQHIPQLLASHWEEPEIQLRSVFQGLPPLGAAVSLFGS